MFPKIAIIIPLYNMEALLRETLQSILSQKFENWECILVDDDSTDNTLKVAKEFQQLDARFKAFNRPEHLPKGANSCRNFGFEKSVASWVMWLDGDDLLTANGLSDRFEHANQSLDAVVTQLQFVTHPDLKPIKKNKIQSQDLMADYLVGNVSFFICGGLWNRTFLDKQGLLFDPTIRNLDDWDFNLRLLYANPRLCFIEIVTVLYRKREGSLTNELEKLNPLEIHSEIFAREKHISLLNKNYPREAQILFEHLIKRIHFFYKKAMSSKDPNKKEYFKMYVSYKMKQKNSIEIVKVYFGYIVYSLFNRGYSLLR